MVQTELLTGLAALLWGCFIALVIALVLTGRHHLDMLTVSLVLADRLLLRRLMAIGAVSALIAFGVMQASLLLTHSILCGWLLVLLLQGVVGIALARIDYMRRHR